ncbi:MAG: hypothetical protein K9M44_03770 [Candidatus Pacebacteria bacterium]|nr:hypothetical protein [Candidatus Paceibacterota bacterium]
MEKPMSEKDIIKTLKNQDIKPNPRYKFLFKKYLLWVSAILAIILGALSLAIIYYFIRNQDIGLSLKEFSGIQTIFIYIPYLWIIILTIFLAITAYNLKHFEFGYRLKLSQAILGYFIASIILSIFIYNLGLADSLQKTFTNKFPAYQKYTHHRLLMWQKPEEGRLLGKILFNQEKQKYILEDFQGKNWYLNFNHLKQKPMFKISPLETVRIVGEKENPESFRVYEVLPIFKGPGSKCPACSFQHPRP